LATVTIQVPQLYARFIWVGTPEPADAWLPWDGLIVVASSVCGVSETYLPVAGALALDQGLERKTEAQIVSITTPNTSSTSTFYADAKLLTIMSSEQNIKSALVIGGCGNLGHNVVKKLLELDPQPRISVFDLRTTQNRCPGVEYHDVDITNKYQVDVAMTKARPQVVFHTASPPPALLDLDLYLKVNVEGTRILLQSAKVS
jgi:hypothetical protein